MYLSQKSSTLKYLNSPFSTSVPSCRVGSEHESVRSNDEFKQVTLFLLSIYTHIYIYIFPTFGFLPLVRCDIYIFF
ncbi:hypothetical protein ABFX02_03G091100 [Erythranthe guttata]